VSTACALSNAAGALDRNARYYDALVSMVERLDPVRDAEALIAWVEEAVGVATFHHAGRFVDGAMENPLLTIGERLPHVLRTVGRPQPGFKVPSLVRDGRRHVLHVVTTLHWAGGIGRAVPNWIASDPDSRHIVLVTRQDHEVRPWVHDIVRANGGELILLPPGAPAVWKAAWLRDIAHTTPVDLVVLHHSWDAVPIVAFATSGGPAVAFANHSDHAFWIGGTVSDLIFNFRQSSVELNAERRFTRRDTVVPLPLLDRCSASDRDEARARLGIPPDQPMLVSVGRAEKYRPLGDQSFFVTLRSILAQNPGAHCYVVGIAPDEAAAHMGGNDHPRLHCTAFVENPSDYRAAADVYLESFPWGSHTAFLEACLAGVPTVPAYAPLTPLLASYHSGVADLVVNPADEQEYIDRTNALLRDAEKRAHAGERLRARIRASHVGGGWQEHAHRVYDAALCVPHLPARIPREPCRRASVDLALSAWLETQRPPLAADSLHARAAAVAHELRDRGDYRGSLRLLREAGSLWGRSSHTLKAMAKLAPHWVCRRVTGTMAMTGGA
jgi:glycosyltransferase involved in cell wall biosynthesis